MFERLRKAQAQLPYLPESLRLIWGAARTWTLAWSGLLVLQGLLPIALVYLTGAFVDSLSASIQAKEWSVYTRSIQWVGLIALLLLVRQSLESLTAWVRTVQAELVQDHVYELIHAKAIELDLSFYDSPEYYDRLHRARMDAYDRPVALLENIGALIQNALTFLAMAGLLSRFAWWLPIVLLAGMAPALGVVTQHAFREYAWRHHSTAARRKVNYFDWILTDRDSAAELRLFKLGDPFRHAYQTIRGRLRKEYTSLVRSQAFGELSAGVVALLTTGAVMVWMVWRLTLGEVTLGEVAMLYQAFNQGQKLMQTLLSSFGQILRNILFIENLFEYLKLKPRQAIVPVSKSLGNSLTSGVRFENVTFRYPGSERLALRDFNLTVPAGQIAAIVGENGAGKSTVIKLLCRYYDPDSGRVLIDGKNLLEINPVELWGSLTVLFQQPVHYHDTAGNNIAFGDRGMDPSGKEVIQAGMAAGAHELIMQLPAGYETVLGKWFGGAELSSGEWQRLALARAFLRKAPIMILDEPTSAMDSWAEIEWMSRFRSLAEGRTVILITHRFTTAMQADVIHVMSSGRIIESGSHPELMNSKGKYAESWMQQMRQAEKNANALKQSK